MKRKIQIQFHENAGVRVLCVIRLYPIINTITETYMKNIYIILFLICVELYSCKIDPVGYKYNIGTFPETPVNMGDINSEYDDYNSTSPILGGTSPLCFSSNRKSEGKNFDIIYKLLDVILYKSNGKLSVVENTNGALDVYSAYSNLANAVKL